MVGEVHGLARHLVPRRFEGSDLERELHAHRLRHEGPPPDRRRFVLDHEERPVAGDLNLIAPARHAQLRVGHVDGTERRGTARGPIVHRPVQHIPRGRLCRVGPLARGFQPCTSRAERLVGDQADRQWILHP